MIIGCMGAGKSTVSKALSEKIGFRLYDSDAIIEKRYQMSLEEIHRIYSSEGFFNIESKLLKEISSYKELLVLSPGGGAVLRKETREILKNNFLVIYLQANADCLFKRIRNNLKGRPLLQVHNPAEKLAEILDARTHFYEECAQIVVNTENKSVEEVLQEICNFPEVRNILSVAKLSSQIAFFGVAPSPKLETPLLHEKKKLFYSKL